MSDCIRYICLRRGDYEDREPNLEQMQLGSAIEYAVAARYAAHFPDRYLQLRELSHDGIYFNPDLIDYPAWSVGEIKLTWASMKHAWDSALYAKYWMQLAAYSKGIDAHSTWLEVFYIRGDYKSKFVGYRKWERTFTQYELTNNWCEIQRARDKILEEQEERGV